MTRDSSRCPDPEVLAAFVAGNLSGEELELVAEHLRTCADCRVIVGDGARYERNEPARHKVLPWRWLAAAAALGGLAFLAMWFVRSRAANEPLHALIAATPRDTRDLEPRLAGGFPWAPLRPAQRDAETQLDPDQMKLVGVAGNVLERTEGDPSLESRHAAALARLLVGRPAEAAAALTALAASAPANPELWSDLAAARYAAALKSQDASLLASALAAADTALRLDPKSTEGLFNRALIIERLGLREQARTAWNAYLAVDRNSEWAREAEKHLQALSGDPPFRSELERRYPALVRGETDARALVKRYPQESRVWGESEILNRWGQSYIAGDTERASEHLSLARFIGDELAHSTGEELLEAAVRAIDQADPARALTLARAHVRFRRAQQEYQKGGPKLAEPEFRAAAEEFGEGQSPMALTSRYFAANATFDQARIDEARAELEAILAQSDPRFAAHAAQVKWQLGIVYASLGRWGQSMRTMRESIATFERLGETNYEMTVREILAEVYDRIGEPREAWDQRLAALQELGRSEDLRLQVATHAVARGAALRGDWPVALSFLDLQTAMPRVAGDQLMVVETLLSRARAAGHLGLSKIAMSDLDKAALEMRGMNDDRLRERAEAERLMIRGFLAESPASAVTHISQAIEFNRAKGRRMFLPELLLERGRAYATLKKQQEAAADFEAGIDELESQRMSIEAADERWGMFAVADELFDEAAALALSRGDVAGAFEYSERARARELIDAVALHDSAASLARSQEPLAKPGGIVVEYLVLPEKLVIFIVDGARVRAIQDETDGSIIAGEVDQLTRSAMANNRADFIRLATKMYDRLLAPLGSELASNETLVVIPDVTLSIVPFAALVDSAGRHVVERRSVIVTPSVTAYTRLAARKRSTSRPRLLLVAGPDTRDDDTGRLTAQRQEIDAVTAEYAQRSDYLSQDANSNAMQERARRADVIHFVGHAVIPDASQGGALVTSRRMGLEAQLDVREIAAMRLRETGLVVLAACGTARGHGRTGDASISLARAFLAAGVPSVAATLWPIDDRSAADFFPRLHHYLARGMPPAEALRAAQLEWVRRPDAPVSVWASVQIIGS